MELNKRKEYWMGNAAMVIGFFPSVYARKVSPIPAAFEMRACRREDSRSRFGKIRVSLHPCSRDGKSIASMTENYLLENYSPMRYTEVSQHCSCTLRRGRKEWQRKCCCSGLQRRSIVRSQRALSHLNERIVRWKEISLSSVHWREKKFTVNWYEASVYKDRANTIKTEIKFCEYSFEIKVYLHHFCDLTLLFEQRERVNIHSMHVNH